MTAIVECLERIKTRISAPDRWTQNCAARNADGRVRSYTQSDAVAFCLDSALRLDTPKELQPHVRVLLESCTRDKDFIRWQDEDGRRHADVLRLIDKAIAKATMLGDALAVSAAV